MSTQTRVFGDEAFSPFGSSGAYLFVGHGTVGTDGVRLKVVLLFPITAVGDRPILYRRFWICVQVRVHLLGHRRYRPSHRKMVRAREPQSLNFHSANRPLLFLPPARWPQGSRKPGKRNKIFLATKFGRRDGQDHQVSNFSFSNSNSGSSCSLEPGVSNTSDFQNPGLYRLRVTRRLPYLCH